ncbi:MAG TPA: tetraacyldisaccharide 4'-kinase, partial [Candidatus Tenderia sp.]|nr:tetraacyldisaccharide 4'-kinase [Candidatus Tenderia sp.]
MLLSFSLPMNALERRWYQSPALVLLPIEAFYRAVVAVRRSAYRWGVFSSTRLDVPVIVVGNINVGGAGKTPLTIWLVKYLKEAGYQPGIITRGYGGKATSWPQTVAADSDPALVGDEPVIMARRCDCPVVAGPDRVRAAKVLLANSACNILISDDGMQHYRLQRDLEIVVVDGERRFGNNHCLPAGPLREPVKRLKEVDYIVTNGNARTGEWCMSLVQEGAISLADASSVPLSDFKGQAVHAVAGIGNPARFFNQLRAQGIKVIEHAFPDHHPYVADDIQ